MHDSFKGEQASRTWLISEGSSLAEIPVINKASAGANFRHTRIGYLILVPRVSEETLTLYERRPPLYIIALSC